MTAVYHFNVADGRVLWQRNYEKDFGMIVPLYGTTWAPIVDGNRLITLVGGADNANFVAFNKLTGEEIWRARSSDPEPGYTQPTIIEAGGVRQLIAWNANGISGLDPATGKAYWDVPFTVQLALTIATPVHSGPYLFVATHYSGARMFKLDEHFINTDRGELVIAKVSPQGFQEIGRTNLIAPTHPQIRRRAAGLVAHWSQPAYANKHLVTRNDNEIVRISLAKE